MGRTDRATPLLIREGQKIVLNSVSREKGGDNAYPEKFIQELAFEHPVCLPINEIDQTYSGLVPVCMELNTSAGYVDALYATPNGRLAILEAKLWRNPEARRRVVSQILDYARAISRWDYEDLQREVSRTTGVKGNAIYELVAKNHPDVEEAHFVDEIQRSLKRGEFLLIIVGDGIREGAGAIAEFLQGAGNLEFTFGLVELSLYRAYDSDDLLVVPQVVAKTTIISRSVIRLSEGVTIDGIEEDSGTDEAPPGEIDELQKFYLDFWTEFLSELRLDDATQPMPNPSRKGFLIFPMPPSRAVVRVVTYFWKEQQYVGVYLSFSKGNYAPIAYQRLYEEADEINKELGAEADWHEEPDNYSITIRKQHADIYAPENREEIKAFLATNLNCFINVFRPRLEAIAKDVH